MAITVHPPPLPPANVISRKSGSVSLSIGVRAAANFEQNKQQRQERQVEKGRRKDIRTSRPSSPLGASDEVASRLGYEIAVANLERLFWQQAATGDRPPASGEPSSRPVRVAYQGSRGSYCQEAAARAFPSSACEAFPCAHMEEAFDVLEDHSADRAVVPAENSLDGPIDRNLDLLLRHPGVRILGELVLPVNHCLLSLPGVLRSGLRRVISHPQALSHCRRSLEALGLEVDEVSSATDAARFVAENRVADTAVIGSRMAAREFGLRVQKPNFQDHHLGGNFTRFLQLGLSSGHAQASSSIGGGAAHKTTVVFTLDGGASDLFRAMWIFESRDLRVTRVDHRPNRAKPLRVVDRGDDGLRKVTYLDYVFVLDVEGSASDPVVEAALARLNEMAAFARVLGSYTCTCQGIN
ncbi:hypothetical protein C4D60_Mb08t14600 [Musa balbisiana]|uniref:Prephenate dehydratase domain-containing protein n=1 Tax=Musa balbisiana TaxID=52838 RepID=A0A4S8K3S1_MUSBA|nr:hypothetical protein C4D60_Mb08t14600 [Musa balbisiana]